MQELHKIQCSKSTQDMLKILSVLPMRKISSTSSMYKVFFRNKSTLKDIKITIYFPDILSGFKVIRV